MVVWKICNQKAKVKIMYVFNTDSKDDPNVADYRNNVDYFHTIDDRNDKDYPQVIDDSSDKDCLQIIDDSNGKNYLHAIDYSNDKDYRQVIDDSNDVDFHQFVDDSCNKSLQQQSTSGRSDYRLTNDEECCAMINVQFFANHQIFSSVIIFRTLKLMTFNYIAVANHLSKLSY